MRRQSFQGLHPSQKSRILLFSSFDVLFLFFENAFNRYYLFLIFEEFHSWCVGRAIRNGILVKSQEFFFFYPLAACCGGRVNIFQKNKLTLNNAVCFAICNQPTKLVLNLCPFGLEGFCQLTCYCNASFWANFLSKFFFEYFSQYF